MSINFNRDVYDIIDFKGASWKSLEQNRAAKGIFESAQTKLGALNEYVNSLGLSGDDLKSLQKQIASIGKKLTKLEAARSLGECCKEIADGNHAHLDKINLKLMSPYRAAAFFPGGIEDEHYNVTLRKIQDPHSLTPQQINQFTYAHLTKITDSHFLEEKEKTSNLVGKLMGKLKKLKQDCETAHCSKWIVDCKGDINVNGTLVKGNDELDQRIQNVNKTLLNQFNATTHPRLFVTYTLNKGDRLYMRDKQNAIPDVADFKIMFDEDAPVPGAVDFHMMVPASSSRSSNNPQVDNLVQTCIREWKSSKPLPSDDCKFTLFVLNENGDTKVLQDSEFSYKISRGEVPKVKLYTASQVGADGKQEETSTVKLEAPRPKPTEQTLAVPYNTKFGESLIVCGEGAGLSWNAKEGKELKWSEGNWKIDLPSQNAKFKILLKNQKGDLKWEQGPDRAFEPGKQVNVTGLKF